MPSFDTSGNTTRVPFGKNQYLRSTRAVKTEPATCAKGAVPAETIDGTPTKVLQSGEVIAKITSGPDAGKFGPFQAGVADGRQTAANIVGVNDTFAPWQLNERDIEIATVYDAAVVQAWCFERDASGARVPLSNATRDAMLALPNLQLRFS